MKKKQEMVLNTLKFLFSVVLIVDVALRTNHQRRYLLVGILSLLWITFFSQSLIRKHKHLARSLNNALSLILNAQYMVFRLGGTFTSMDMLTSFHTIGALKGGNTNLYIFGTVLVVLFSFIPIYDIRLRPKYERILGITALAGNVALSAIIGTTYSALLNVGTLASNAIRQYQMNKQIEVMAQNLSEDGSKLNDPVDNGYKYPDNEHLPNVVLIFTEGFSQSIVDDPRNIMPNVKYYENNESLFFTNYYNHTSATYRGIPCQLHSGFQFDDLDDNHLTSLQNIFDMYGYDTTLVNPEPYQTDFAKHLSKMGFDHFVDWLGGNDPVSDKRMYENILDQLKKNTGNKPKLITLYTFGTHVGQESPDEKFGDGSSNVLNRFHNVDAQFGRFMTELKNSTYADNTLVVFTTDHATYVDDDYKVAFPKENRVHNFIDQIPMLFWYKGIKPEKFDCQSRTSIDMGPTVLDYLNMKTPSDFLGTSLFAGMPKNHYQQLVETTYCQPRSDGYWTVRDGNIHPMDPKDEEYMQKVVTQYCARSTMVKKGKNKNDYRS